MSDIETLDNGAEVITHLVPDGLTAVPCPECDGSGCDVCEGTGSVLVPVRTDSPTATTDTHVHTSELREEAQGEAEGDAEHVRGVSPTFGGLSASEAASLRWDKERARQAELEAVETGSDVIVRTTVPVSTIIKRLSADAQKGNTQAARELRAWLSEVAVESRTDLSDLDERTRQALLARLLRDIEEDEQQAGEEGHEGDEHLVDASVAALPDATPAVARSPVSTMRGPLVAVDGAETLAPSETCERAGTPTPNEPLAVRTETE